MTTGQLVFFSGVGLLGLTVILAIIFAIKKPAYHPEAGIASAETGATGKLTNAYSTEKMTIRRDKPQTQGTELLDEKTELLTGDGTLLLDDAERSGSGVQRQR